MGLVAVTMMTNKPLRLEITRHLEVNLYTTCFHCGETQKPTSHPVASALKICISSKRLQSEVRKKTLLEIKRQNKVRGDKGRGKQIGTFRQILNV